MEEMSPIIISNDYLIWLLQPGKRQESPSLVYSEEIGSESLSHKPRDTQVRIQAPISVPSSYIVFATLITVISIVQSAEVKPKTKTSFSHMPHIIIIWVHFQIDFRI